MIKRLALALAVVALNSGPLPADTVYQTNSEDKPVVIQRNAIVIKEDSGALVYKHFDLRERRVVKIALNKGSLDYSVVTSRLPERQQIVDTWKRFGYSATVTDQAGKTTKVFDAFLDFYPPGGRGSLLEALPARTVIPLQLDQGGVDEPEFSKIERIEFQGDRVKITLRSGQVEQGRLLNVTNQPVEVRFLGITEHYDPTSEDVFDFSLPLSRVKEIRFEP